MTSDQEAFLQGFFSDGNEITWEEIDSGTLKGLSVLSPWLERFTKDVAPAALPRVQRRGDRVRTTWYVLGDSVQDANLIRDEIRAFVGGSFSDIDPFRDPFDGDDPIDRFVLDHYPGSVKFTISDGTGDSYRAIASKVRERLDLWARLREARPTQRSVPVVPIGDLLTGFEESLRLGRVDLADEALSQIRVSGTLAQHNLIGLRFLLMAARSDWQGIWDDAYFDELVQRPIPRRVSQAMVRAAYCSQISSLAEKGDAAVAIQRFREQVITRCGPLLGSRVAFNSPEAVVAVLMRAICSESVSASQLADIRSSALEFGADESWVDALIQTVEPGPPSAVPEAAQALSGATQAFVRNELDLAWSLALEAEHGWDRVLLLLRLAVQNGTLEWAHVALGEFESARERHPERESEYASHLAHGLRHGLLGDAAPIVPEGWLEWADRLAQSEAWPQAVSLAEQGSREWSWEASREAGFAAFAESIESVSDQNVPYVRRATPHLLRSLELVPESAADLGRVFGALFLVVLTDDAPGQTFFPTIQDLCERWIRAGISADEYLGLLEEVQSSIARYSSPSQMDALLDLTDTLDENRCPSRGARDSVMAAVVAAGVTHLTRLDAPQLHLVREVARRIGADDTAFTLGLEGLESVSESGEAYPVGLRSKVVALYSLETKALARARAVLTEAVPGIDVRTSSDKVATDSLVSLARTADLFVVASRSAKHAATDAIRANRSLPIVYALGKGSASLVRAAWEWQSHDQAH